MFCLLGDDCPAKSGCCRGAGATGKPPHDSPPSTPCMTLPASSRNPILRLIKTGSFCRPSVPLCMMSSDSVSFIGASTTVPASRQTRATAYGRGAVCFNPASCIFSRYGAYLLEPACNHQVLLQTTPHIMGASPLSMPIRCLSRYIGLRVASLAMRVASKITFAIIPPPVVKSYLPVPASLHFPSPSI